MTKFKKLFSIVLIQAVFISGVFAATSFTGFAGGKMNYSGNTEATEYDPNLQLQAFFAGQFNFSQNLWSHMEFSIDTNDLISESLFDATPSLFQIDELSLINRSLLLSTANYFSIYMGTYDPIGSDIFLQRYFGCEPIASKITESWLGLAGSILYPHFGIGISDVFKNYDKPVAFGGYAYVNHEDDRYYVFNADLRGACVYRFFTCDLACGLGVPMANKYQGEDVIVAIDKMYWHAGTTILIGNNYTQSCFLQAGIFNASFSAKRTGMVVGTDDIYLLFEPRFIKNNAHLNLTVFSLPQDTVNKFLFIDDTLGADMNIYCDSIVMGAHTYSIGVHISGSFTDKSFLDIPQYKTLTSNGFNINFTPYFSTNFLNGQLHGQVKVKFMELSKKLWYNAFSADVGFNCKL